MALPVDPTMAFKALQYILVAGMLTGGSMIMSNREDNIRQDERIQTLQNLGEEMKDTREAIAGLDKSLAVLKQQLEYLVDDKKSD